MSKVVECIKCICGCNKLTRERIKEILYKKIHGFLSDEAAVEMFQKFIPSESRTHKHIAIVNQAKQYQDIEIDFESDEWEEFVEDLEEHLEDELKENPDTQAALEKVIFEYSKKIETSTDYKNFTRNLKDKYKTRFKQQVREFDTQRDSPCGQIVQRGRGRSADGNHFIICKLS
ncbi:uncharacterized protein LOC129776172 isoform X2 [Toxorhynchites rutilus septentrionalis]|uniref:uncharacterized protein LOC129776172 isoform X2 n=1 Tax=Toxorhynchites rutilus septentrionalis TaxID=329112 RepID=UPI00247876B5|nr:uncharacterized protein LOC129776172 isoform X2 [Toxorhynchites rutilus septentrionalis]XP_055637637.1 uncharacterized protein LOC129776172 isoform X2 [Toxorhynchites rutilus septentrionalis]XP_055637647.1 uncharacterized protein LOC129776172 isoform X2 [Toxorhynchites rutilus septentrionalis]XP_055637657.1 uncharacterized protein LOC129776172 isoform X2 [Toxorhynchites rutilus septentrionalis]XP_055637665.1 uncharacterized protein LOC129776172 isoform X2 [Toxorhynchites rutilus septentriona